MTSIAISPRSLSVNVGFPCDETLSFRTHMAMLDTAVACVKAGIHFDVKGVSGCALVTVARNRVVDAFLKDTAEYLFWIDSDIVWKSQDFVRLLVLASEVDVVCALYPTKTEERSLFLARPDLETFEISPYGLVEIEGAGLGFCCVKREVIERLAETKPLTYDTMNEIEIADVFRLDSIIDDQGRRCGRGEDMAFFSDVRELGYKVWLDPQIKLGHVGACEYRRDPVEALRLGEFIGEKQEAFAVVG